MSNAATAISENFLTTIVLDFDTMLAQLPAEKRAQVIWAKLPVERGLLELRTEPLKDALVARVSAEIWKPISAVFVAFAEIADSYGDWRLKFADDLRNEEAQLVTFLADEDSAETLSWILCLVDAIVRSVPTGFSTTIDEATAVRLGADEGFQPYIRMLVALMAATETRKVDGDRQRARDLIDIAFLDLGKFRRKLNVWISPVSGESSATCRLAVLASANRLRHALSDEDWVVLNQSRMKDLR